MFYLLFSPNKLSFSIFSWLACIFRQMGGLKIQMSNICIKMCAFSLPFLESCCFWTFRFLEKEKFFLTIVPCTWKGISLFSLHFIGWRSLSRYWDWEREETKLKRSVKRAVCQQHGKASTAIRVDTKSFLVESNIIFLFVLCLRLSPTY